MSSDVEQSSLGSQSSSPLRRRQFRVATEPVPEITEISIRVQPRQFRTVSEVTDVSMVWREATTSLKVPAVTIQAELAGTAGSATIFGIGYLVGSILKYGSNFLMQRGLGVSGYGLYSLGWSLISLVAAILNLGLDDAMTRYVAIYRGKKQINSLRGLTIFCTAIVGVVGILGALLIMVFAAPLAAYRHQPHAAFILQLLAPAIPLLCMQIIWYSGLRGFKDTKACVLSERILMPAALIVLVGAALLLQRHLVGIVIATIISILVGTIFCLSALFRWIAQMSKLEPERYEFREWLSFATPNLLTSLVDMALESVDTLLLAIFAVSDTGIGQYTAALKLSGFISMPLYSLNVMFAPNIAELHSKGEMQKLAVLFKVVTKWTITFSLPIFLVVVLFSRSLLDLSGDNFVDAWPLLLVLALGSIINTGTGAVGNMLIMTGHQKLSFLNSLTAIIVNLVLGVILTPHYGAMGTAISTGVAVAVVNLMKLLQVRLLVKVQPYRWDTLKPLGAGILSAGLVGVLLYLLYIYHVHLLVQFVLVPVFMGSYIGLLLLFKGSSEDKVVINALRKKLRGRRK